MGHNIYRMIPGIVGRPRAPACIAFNALNRTQTIMPFIRLFQIDINVHICTMCIRFNFLRKARAPTAVHGDEGNQLVCVCVCAR